MREWVFTEVNIPMKKVFVIILLKIKRTIRNWAQTIQLLLLRLCSPAISLGFTIMGKIFCVCDRF